MSSLPVKTVECDLLCIGGGPAGLMAAIRAGELGVRATVADKSNTKSGGSGSPGNDHIRCYIPEAHGQDTKAVVEAFYHAPGGGARPDLAPTWLALSGEVVKLWDSWGIPMKYKGKWEFQGHAFPGRPRLALKYAGGNQKEVLTRQALKTGSQIMNRVTVFELLGDGDRVTGALGYDTWNDQLVVFQAKAVFLGTGRITRLYPGSTPGWLFNVPISPYVTGDGRAMVYRLGGELCDMEFTGQWAGPKYFSRSGKGTWIGVLRDPHDNPIGPFINKPDKLYGDITSDIWPTVFSDYMNSGKGPVYVDCRGASREDVDEMLYWLSHEGNALLVEHMAEEGIDPGKHAIEFRTYEIGVRGGVWWSNKGETTTKGLFSAGDEYLMGMANAAVFGWVAGETVANYVKGASRGELTEEQEKIDEKRSLLENLLGRQEGATWQEANIALQNIMGDYAGLVRSETMLDQGLRNLGRLREKVYQTLAARNGHEVGRCLEVLNLLDVGEAVMLSARERKETRGGHKRVDYPFTNPLQDTNLLVSKKDGKPVFRWKDKK